MRHTAVIVLVLTAACAPKGPSPQLVADIAKADASLRAGCYTCLQEALAIYQKNKVAQGAFDAALLLAIRERELGIPAQQSWDRATSLALPASKPVLDAAALVIGETGGFDPEQRAAESKARRPIDPGNPVRVALEPLFGKDPVATYVALSLDCESPKIIETLDMAGLTKQFSGQPLMEFRLARCGRPALAPPLVALRTADPRWTDTLMWEARRELVGSPQTGINFPGALRLFAEGRAAFPKSLAMTMQWANVNVSAEEFEAALTGFDEVLAIYPEHRDALNGRMQALSYLLRHDEAIASATRLIDLGTWHIGDAYYWRAWNRYHLKDYEPAWVDVENATKGLSNPRVYMLAGLIAYARKDLPTAEQRFDRAFELDNSQCDARWMSGMVSIDREDLKVGAPKFARAMTCFISAARGLREDADRLEKQIEARGTAATARETRLLERNRRDADAAEEKSAQSAFNAAQCYARTGGKSIALNLVGVAIDHPKMKEKAEALKAAIEKLPQ